MFEKDSFRTPPPLPSWRQAYKYAASNVRQVRVEFTPGTHTHTHTHTLLFCCVADKDDVGSTSCLTCVFSGVFQ